MRERVVEAYLLACVVERGGKCIKLSPLGDSGWPDRLVIIPGGVIGFLELKRPGKAPTVLQQERIDTLTALGCVAGWASTLFEVTDFLQRLAPSVVSAADIGRVADRLQENGGLL